MASVVKFVNRGLTYLRAVDHKTIVDKNGKSKRVQVTKSLGNYEKLKAKNPLIYEELVETYAKLRLEKEEEKIASVSKEADRLLKESEENPNNRFLVSYNYAPFILQSIWNKKLTLTDFLNRVQRRNYSNISYNLNEILSFSSFMRILNPDSFLSLTRRKDDYLGDYLSDVDEDDIYRSLDSIAELKPNIMKHVNKAIDKLYDRKLSLVFYDCTNTYFETDLDDLDRAKRKLRNKYKELFRNPSELSKLQYDSFVYKTLDDYINYLVDKELEDYVPLRMRGRSKEQRFDLPLVSIALVIDDEGIPIDFQVFPGNASEMVTMEHAIKSMCDTYGIKDIIVVADKGLNSLNNLLKLTKMGHGFIVSQSLHNLSADIISIMHDKTGYKSSKDMDDIPYQDIDLDSSIEYSGDKIFSEKACYKSIDYCKQGKVLLSADDDKASKVSLDCKLMFSFSPIRYARDMQVLNEDLARAKEAIANKEDINSKRGAAWKSLTKVTKKDKDGNEITGKPGPCKAVSLDTKVLEKRKKLAGFSAIVYHHHSNMNTEIEDEEVLASYHKLLRIEECFRILKSQLQLRPMYVRKKEHIEAHCLICILSLIMVRVLQKELKLKGHNLSINEIVDALNSANVGALGYPNKVGYFMMSYTDSNEDQNLKTILERLGLKLKCGKLQIREFCNNLSIKSMPWEKLMGMKGLKAIKDQYEMSLN